MSEFETLQLTNNADTIIIGSQTGYMDADGQI